MGKNYKLGVAAIVAPLGMTLGGCDSESLLAKGANVEAETHGGITALDIAKEFNHLEIINILEK